MSLAVFYEHYNLSGMWFPGLSLLCLVYVLPVSEKAASQYHMVSNQI